MKTKAKKVRPSFGPQDVVADYAWYYESRRGIELISYPIVLGISPDHIKIPWSKLMKSAARCGWKVQKIKPSAR